MSYFKILLIDMLTLCMRSESKPACQISSDQTSSMSDCLGQTEVAVDWSAVTSSRLHRWDVLQCVLQRQEAHSVEWDWRKICWGFWSKSRLNSDLFVFCSFSECRVVKSQSYGRISSMQGRCSPRSCGPSRRSKSPGSSSSGMGLYSRLICNLIMLIKAFL